MGWLAGGLHPVIRVGSFLLLAGCLASGVLQEVTIAFLLLTIAYLRVGLRLLRLAWPMLRRMRWLLVSLLILYLWFTPATPLFAYGPSLAGFQEGLLRIAILVLLALAVNLLLQTTSRMQLIAALDWFASPLCRLGLLSDRLALRLVLSLETVVAAQQLVRQNRQHQSAPVSRLTHIGTLAADVFEDVLQRAAHTPCHTLEIPDCGWPPAGQWLLPLALGGLFLFAG